jgi:hypothetical protein
LNKWKVIEYTKEIESVLEKYYGASGKGLHSKLTSVENKLDGSIVRKIRYIATIRNKLVHDETFSKLPKRYFYDCRSIIKLLKPSRRKRLTLIMILLFAIVAFFIIIKSCLPML